MILASQSLRRSYLLKKLKIPFSVEPASVNERSINGEKPYQLVQRLAEKKAKTVAERHAEAIIIGADTIVALNDKIIGKPTSRKQAQAILNELSGKTHLVFTGVALIQVDSMGKLVKNEIFYEQTAVTFTHLSPSLINAYVETGEPMDKAGGYGIQDKWGAAFVEKMNGDFYNVMGLPLHALIARLNHFAPYLLNFNS